jgi:hypothetical protein
VGEEGQAAAAGLHRLGDTGVADVHNHILLGSSGNLQAAAAAAWQQQQQCNSNSRQGWSVGWLKQATDILGNSREHSCCLQVHLHDALNWQVAACWPTSR